MEDSNDLDAFFDEVEEVEEEVKNNVEELAAENDIKQEIDEPLAKKARIVDDNRMKGKELPLSNANHENALVIGKKTASTLRVKASYSSAPLPYTSFESHQPQQNIRQTAHTSNLSQPPLPHGKPPPPMALYPSSNNSHLPSQPPTNQNINNIPNRMVHTVDSGTSQIPTKVSKRSAAGKEWVDETLSQFPENDFRLFIGNLAKDINDSKLAAAFSSKYPSFVMARVCCHNSKNDMASKGYGFVSLMDYKDCAKAIREMDQSWLGSRPIKVKLSEWKKRDLTVVRKTSKKSKGRKRR